MKCSIIIPMYNVELYIERCLFSCLSQDISSDNYEIIIVNDGSLDGSLQIAERFAAQNENICIISQVNAGLSMARNTGLTHAKGEYVWFIDSDDSIRENCLGRLIEQCEIEHLDLLAIGAADLIGYKESRRYYYLHTEILSGGEILNSGQMQHCVPFTIYSREFLMKNHLRFYPDIFHEDSEFSPRAYYYAQRVGFTNEIVYLVTINPNSITRTVNYKKSFDCLKVAISIHKFQNNVAKENNKSFFHNYISLLINNAMANLMIKANDISSKNIDLFLEEMYENRYLFKHMRNSTTLRYRLEGYLFMLFPKYTLYIYTWLKFLDYKK